MSCAPRWTKSLLFDGEGLYGKGFAVSHDPETELESVYRRVWNRYKLLFVPRQPRFKLRTMRQYFVPRFLSPDGFEKLGYCREQRLNEKASSFGKLSVFPQLDPRLAGIAYF